MLTIKDITKKYQRRIVLNKISFEVQKGSISGIIGPNGAGKSTVLKIIAGILPSDTGQIYFKGKILTAFNQKKEIISYMPEYIQLYPNIFVYDFIKLTFDFAEYDNKEIIEILGLKKVFRKKISDLSKGYHQRLKLFFALSNNKDIVILDEPFDGFDPIQLIDIFNFIREENKKERTFILSIHQLNQAEKICSHYILLNEGKIVTKGNMEQIKLSLDGDNLSLEEIFIKALR